MFMHVKNHNKQITSGKDKKSESEDSHLVNSTWYSRWNKKQNHPFVFIFTSFIFVLHWFKFCIWQFVTAVVSSKWVSVYVTFAWFHFLLAHFSKINIYEPLKHIKNFDLHAHFLATRCFLQLYSKACSYRQKHTDTLFHALFSISMAYWFLLKMYIFPCCRQKCRWWFLASIIL